MGKPGRPLDTLAQAKKRFRRSFPGHPAGVEGMYLAGVGNALVIMQARLAEARQALEESVNLLPRCVPALQGLAWAKLYAGDAEGALDTMRKAGESRGSLDAIACLASLLSAGRIDEIKPLLDGGESSDWLRENYKPYITLHHKVDGYLSGGGTPPRKTESDSLSCSCREVRHGP